LQKGQGITARLSGRLNFLAIRDKKFMRDDKKAHKASAATLAHIDELLDEALKQTFPASDPVAINIERASDEPRDAKPPPSVS
jgi:hypothetical protein